MLAAPFNDGLGTADRTKCDAINLKEKKLKCVSNVVACILFANIFKLRFLIIA